MKAIVKRKFIFAALTGVGILTVAMILVFGGAMSEIRAQILLAGIIIASVILAGFWIREKKPTPVC